MSAETIPSSRDVARRAVSTDVILYQYEEKLTSLLEELRPESVCDIGGGRNPKIPIELARELCKTYAILDISQGELDLADDGYDKIRGDASYPPPETIGRFDFVFSRMVAEHVKSGETFHRAVYSMLRPGGVALHIFPTLYSLPFVANRIIPDRLAERVLDLIAPRDRSRQGRFPAYYSWTYGPTERQMKRIESVGFEIVEYWAGFGHEYYRDLPALAAVSARLNGFLQRHEVWPLSSYAQVVVRRPR